MSEKYALKRDFEQLVRRFDRLVKDLNKLNERMASVTKDWDRTQGRQIERLEKAQASIDKQIAKLEKNVFGKSSPSGDARRNERDLMKLVDKAIQNYDRQKKRR